MLTLTARVNGVIIGVVDIINESPPGQQVAVDYRWDDGKVTGLIQHDRPEGWAMLAAKVLWEIGAGHGQAAGLPKHDGQK